MRTEASKAHKRVREADFSLVPAASDAAQTRMILVAYRKLLNMREEERGREREREQARITDSTHTSYVQETKGKKCPDSNRDTSMRNLIYI